jgi:NAD(P)-dependent dehydrogenase (short-subunit alcohol dehydrogenase family)
MTNLQQSYHSARDAALDRSILFSFDRSGFERHRRTFVDNDIPQSLEGKKCIITGANSGLGLATADALAQRGAEIWLVCRNMVAGARARETLAQRYPQARWHLVHCDLSSLQSVRQCALRFETTDVDVLINNAGVLPIERQLTADGLEITLATNLIGPYLLTELLLPRLSAAQSPGRVINVSSGGMYSARLNFDLLLAQRKKFDGVRAYAQTKRAMVILTELWAERHHQRGPEFQSMHPGWADTPSVHRSLPTFYRVMRSRLRSPAEGADTAIWLASRELPDGLRDKQGGLFWFDRRPAPTHLVPWTQESQEERQRLWQICRDLAGLEA